METATLEAPPTTQPIVIELEGGVAKQFALAAQVVATAASTDEARQMLTFIHVKASKEGVTLTATDSYHMLRAELPLPFPEMEFVVSAKWLARVVPKRTSIADRYVLTVGNSSVTWTDISNGETFTRRSGPSGDASNFPNVERILAQGDEGTEDYDEERGFNPPLLNSIFKACHKFAPWKPVRVKQLASSSPCRFDIHTTEHGHLIGILMPVRLENS